MFSAQQKNKLAQVVEDTIKSFNHPEIDNDNIHFQLHVDGKESWSWADIRENKKDDPKVDPNPWNEINANQANAYETFAEIFKEVLVDPSKLPQEMNVRYQFIATLAEKIIKREIQLADFSKAISTLTPEEKAAIKEFFKNPKNVKKVGVEFYNDLMGLFEGNNE